MKVRSVLIARADVLDDCDTLARPVLTRMNVWSVLRLVHHLSAICAALRNGGMITGRRRCKVAPGGPRPVTFGGFRKQH